MSNTLERYNIVRNKRRDELIDMNQRKAAGFYIEGVDSLAESWCVMYDEMKKWDVGEFGEALAIADKWLEGAG